MIKCLLYTFIAGIRNILPIHYTFCLREDNMDVTQTEDRSKVKPKLIAYFPCKCIVLE